MNIETGAGGPNLNDPEVLDERIASLINTLIQVADPRLVVNALLGNTASLCQVILAAGKALPQHVAHAFSSSMVDALGPREVAVEEENRIQIVPAGVVPFRRQ